MVIHKRNKTAILAPVAFGMVYCRRYSGEVQTNMKFIPQALSVHMCNIMMSRKPTVRRSMRGDITSTWREYMEISNRNKGKG
jgi:hypothetical protein